jgi:hypothetical protein
MIDDYAKAMELLRQMEANLPIPARPTSAFIRMMRDQGVKIARNQELSIKSVLYMGDEGGIACDITPPDLKNPIICSLTHIRVKSGHPLTKEIRAYQTERQKRLAQSGNLRQPTSFTITPRKKRNR